MGSAASLAAPRVRQAQLARDLGVTRQSINELVSRGILTVDAKGMIDAQLARLALADRVHPGSKTAKALTAAPVPPPPAVPPAPEGDANPEEITSFHVAKTMREIAEARLAQLKLAEQQGELVRVADVKAALASKASALREGLLQIPARLAPLLSAELDQARCHDILQTELRQVLAQLTTELKPAA